MRGALACARTRGRRGRAARAALAGLAGVAALVATPAAAMAGGAATGTVVPLLDCTIQGEDGSFTAVFGYDNQTGTERAIPIGADNKIAPTPEGGGQPIAFQPGVHHGAFSITVGKGASPIWHLDGNQLASRKAGAAACSPGTALPATGNGTGPVIGLVAAGLAGAFLLRRWGRRPAVPAAAGAGSAAVLTSDPGTGDA